MRKVWLWTKDEIVFHSALHSCNTSHKHETYFFILNKYFWTSMKVSGVGLEQKEALKVPTMFLLFFRNIRGIWHAWSVELIKHDLIFGSESNFPHRLSRISSPTSTSMIKISNTVKFVYLSRLFHLNGLVVTIMMTVFWKWPKTTLIKPTL
jgi:hypothetical protein